MMVRALCLISLALLTACTETPTTLAKCDPAVGSKICGVLYPEDIDLLPESDWLVFSEMAYQAPNGEMAFGGLKALNAVTRDIVPLFGPAEANWQYSESMALGDGSCPGRPDPKQFGGHGIDIRRLDNGTVLLAAVNHGDRESIELFSINNGGERPVATWGGCIPLNEKSLHNDVAIAANGDLFFTHFIAHPHNNKFGLALDFIRMKTGGDTGFVYHWSQRKGLVTLPLSEGSASNGISISEDNSVIFVAGWGDESVYRLTLGDGGKIVRDEVGLPVAPDNFSWSPENKLIVVGQEGDQQTNLKCMESEPATCDIPYAVYEIDPDSLTVREIHKGIGAASVAVFQGENLYVGSFASDNIEVISGVR